MERLRKLCLELKLLTPEEIKAIEREQRSKVDKARLRLRACARGGVCAPSERGLFLAGGARLLVAGALIGRCRSFRFPVAISLVAISRALPRRLLFLQATAFATASPEPPSDALYRNIFMSPVGEARGVDRHSYKALL